MKSIFVILTPFHIEILKSISLQFPINLKKSLVFYSNQVSQIQLASLFKDKPSFVEIPSGKISFSDFKKAPIKHSLILRELFDKFNSVANLSLDFTKYELFLGSDKDIFTQILVRKLKKNNQIISTSAFDEGIGYYKPHKKYDFIFRIVFLLLSKPLLKYQLNYVSVLGESKWIDVIYARYPSKITIKNKNILEVLNRSMKPIALSSSKNILVLTSPFSELSIIPLHQERKYYHSIIESYLEKGYTVEIKQHPREVSNKLAAFANNQNVSFIDSSNAAELIDLSRFSKIVNFGSSVVLHVLSQGFPPHNIKTYKLSSKLNFSPVFESTDLILYPRIGS